MPSLTSIANSAANGWRKLKDETLNYTPPSTEGPKPLRSPDRKLRKLSVIQFTDLPRPTLKSKLSREIQIGLPQTYIRQCETDRFFRENHKHYFSEDSILGLIIISLALNTSTSPATVHGHIFTKCGPMSIPPIRISADSSCYSAVYHLNDDSRGNLAKQGAAMMLLKYFANTPGLVMEEARRSADGGLWGGVGGVCAFDEMHAADIAGRCERLKGSDVTIDLKSAMEWRGYNRIFVDVVIPNENEVENYEGLAAFLKLFTPTLSVQDADHHDTLPIAKLDTGEDDPASRRSHILEELQSTERHFLARMQHLLQDYHAPLKARAKSTDPLLNMYQVNTIFPRSLEVIVKAHETFYTALEGASEDQIPSLLVEHFEKFKECYPRFLESRKSSTQMLKEQLQNHLFREFVDKQKYGGGLQIGISELLIDPVQRIPRYSLFLNDLLPVFPSDDLINALNIVKEIGLMEKRLEDKTSETWARLKRLIKDLPADLISSSRILLDSVDCVEILPPYSSGANGLQATLCLFSDCLVFIKRGYMEQPLSLRILSEQEDLRVQLNTKHDITGQSQMHATFKGSIGLDKARIARADNALWITMLDELEGKVLGKWTGRVERRFVPCVRQGVQIARFMGAYAEARQLARGKVEESGVTEREEGKLKVDWGVMRRAQYDDVKQRAELALFYVESDSQVAMPYLQSIGAPVVSLSVSFKDGGFKIYEDNTLDIAPFHLGATVYSPDSMPDILFNQIVESERLLTVPYAPANLPAYLTSNSQLLNIIFDNANPSVPKALASLPSSPTKSITSLLSRSPKRRNKDTVDSIRTSAFDSPSTASNSQSSDATSRTTSSSIDDGVIVTKRASIMFLGPETKERGVVAGIRSFVEGLKGKQWQDVEGELNSLSLILQRQVLELVALIEKYPNRTFAVAGSRVEIAYPALRTFIKEHVIKKLGMLLPTEAESRLHTINDMPISEDLKRGRFEDALKDIPTEKAQILRLLVTLLTDLAETNLPEAFSGENAEKVMTSIASLIVGDSPAKDFVPVVYCMMENPSMVFEFLEQKESKFALRRASQAQSTMSMHSTQSSGAYGRSPSPTKRHGSRKSFSSSHGTQSTMSSMGFQRTQSIPRPMSGTLSAKPISSGIPPRRPVTAVDFGDRDNTPKPNMSVRSKATIESKEDEDWIPDHNEASVCLVIDSDEEDVVHEKASEETLRDMVLTANEYFSRSTADGGNWWE